MIQLDWDGIAFSLAKQRLNKIKKMKPVKGYQIFESPRGDGYHVYISLKKPVSEKDSYKLRQFWKDDGNRIIMDVLYRPRHVPHDILFNKKLYMGQVLKERFIEGWSC